MKSTSHASYQTHNVRIGQSREATQLELQQINKAIADLLDAKKAKTERVLVQDLTDAYNKIRQVIRSRIA